MAFRKSAATSLLWEQCQQRFQWERERRSEHPLMCFDDQGAFRFALYHFPSLLRTYFLPTEYNLQLHEQWAAGARVKLLHGRAAAMTRAIRRGVNRDITIRIGDGKTCFERSIFNLKRWIKNRILKRPALYEFRLSGPDCNQRIDHLP